MPIEPGRLLAHYRLIEQIGQGGMGVVWKAADTTLDREVAIKVLPPEFAADEERLARFEREAKLLASLNHPHIAGIYGIHEVEGVKFLAMELVEGEDFSERIRRGPLPLDQALRIARDVASALETAHESGVIHRDLKPANVRLTPQGKAKVLDFGLAKAAQETRGGDPTMSPTMTSAGTTAGMILGTAAYMSPEQAAGQPTDRRCDIWSYGVTLCEMLTGRQMFHGETISHTLADVLRADIVLDTLPSELPPSIRRLIVRCLVRNPNRRLRDIGEARVALAEAIENPQAEAGETLPGTPATASSSSSALPWALAALGLVVAFVAVVALTWNRMDRRPVVEPTRRFSLELPNSGNIRQGDGQAIAISSDGLQVVTRGGAGSDDMLYLRRLDDFDARPLAGTAGARLPKFSPDDRWILFLSSGGLEKISPAGGPPVAIG